jgi:acyl-coenzyme A thioesterase PaaI-like protein
VTDAARPANPDEMRDWGTPRTKTVTWYDPEMTAAAGSGLSGLAFLQALVDGRLPPAPLVLLLGFQAVEAEPGRVVFAGTPDESVYNVLGVVHGGLVCAVHHNVSYTRPVTRDSGALRAVGTVVKPGRRVAFSQAEIFDSAGRLVASATSSCLIMAGSAG